LFISYTVFAPLHKERKYKWTGIVKKYEKPIKMIVVTILDRVVLVMSLPVSFLIVIVEET